MTSSMCLSALCKKIKTMQQVSIARSVNTNYYLQATLSCCLRNMLKLCNLKGSSIYSQGELNDIRWLKTKKNTPNKKRKEVLM